MHAHHSTCEQCVFYRRDTVVRGQCRRYAPAAHHRDEPDAPVVWPLVRAIDWCGDFEPMPGPEHIRP